MTAATLPRVLLALCALALLALAVVALLAQARGRDSRFHHWLSALAAPVSERVLAADDAGLLTVPATPDLRAPPGPAWRWLHGELADARTGPEGLTLTPNAESVWWLNRRGPMLYQRVQGDVSVRATVRTRKRSDPSRPPDMEWQFAGLILRSHRGSAVPGREDYVFNVVGFRGASLQVETKSTTRGRSQVDAFDWPSGDADLRIDRRGSRFSLFVRADAHADWRHLIDHDRPDLPAELQLGLIVYAYSEGRGRHDVQGRFEALELR